MVLWLKYVRRLLYIWCIPSEYSKLPQKGFLFSSQAGSLWRIPEAFYLLCILQHKFFSNILQMARTVLPWTGKHRCLAWATFAIFMVGFVLFFVSYVGTSWYVVPVENNAYPPDNPIPPFTLGLFYMCFRGHCKYDLRQDYFVVNLIPQSLCEYRVIKLLAVVITSWRGEKVFFLLQNFVVIKSCSTIAGNNKNTV